MCDEIKNNVFEKCADGYCGITESIKNLGILATKLQKGGLTIPGNVTITGNLKVEKDIEGNKIKGNEYVGDRLTVSQWANIPDIFVHRLVVPDDKEEIQIRRSNNMKFGSYSLKIMNKGSIKLQNGGIELGDDTGNYGIDIKRGYIKMKRGNINVGDTNVIEDVVSSNTNWTHKIKLNANSLNVKYIIPRKYDSQEKFPCNTIIPSVLHNEFEEDWVGFRTHTKYDGGILPSGYMCKNTEWIAVNSHDPKKNNGASIINQPY